MTSGVRAMTITQAKKLYLKRLPYIGQKLPREHPASFKSLAEEFNTSEATAGKICRGEYYKDVYAEIKRGDYE